MSTFAAVVDASYCVKDFNDRLFFAGVRHVKHFVLKNTCYTETFDGVNRSSNPFGRCGVLKNNTLINNFPKKLRVPLF